MRTRTGLITATLLVVAAGTACSGSSKEPKTIRVTVTQTVTPTPSTAAADHGAEGLLKMGAKKDIAEPENDVQITVQALEYQQPYKGPQPQPPQDFEGGDVWATVNVKVCTVKGDVSVSQFPWSLAYADGTSIDVTGSTGGDMPKPEFPMDKTVKPGRCAAGLIAFPVPSDKRPERIVYEPDGSEPTEWAIPGK
ncbi:DUF4352 domain-containing protein [Streptomyces sp. NPDC127091]|uniref:DUF4352 domain-containing protein n=1 Tax=Streptomyces sp. NPDC127091 TaxID=3347134 RepID=UPI003656A36A